ncbi:MAG: HAD family hydrolase [Clostridia bacterium]|nr:HAD family hydrolase [Clostridia bacterium]
MKRRKHIIWDFNGTLLSDTQLAVDVDNYVFDQLGLPRITVEDYRRHMTMPVRNFYPALGVDYNVHPYETISRIWLDAFNGQVVDAGLIPGIEGTLSRMAQAGYTQSILSASYQPSLDEQCVGLDVTKYMVAVDGLKDESAAKKTDIGRMQMERLGLTGEDVWFVGDMLADYELAQALGAACVLVTWGHNSEERVRAAGCPVADTLEALERILLG